jgi:hypothetical protein
VICVVADAEFTKAEPSPCSVLVGVLVPPRFECGVSSGHHDVECRQFSPKLIGQRCCGISGTLTQHANVDLPESSAEHVDGARRRMVVQGYDPHQSGLA